MEELKKLVRSLRPEMSKEKLKGSSGSTDSLASGKEDEGSTVDSILEEEQASEAVLVDKPSEEDAREVPVEKPSEKSAKLQDSPVQKAPEEKPSEKTHELQVQKAPEEKPSESAKSQDVHVRGVPVEEPPKKSAGSPKTADNPYDQTQYPDNQLGLEAPGVVEEMEAEEEHAEISSPAAEARERQAFKDRAPLFELPDLATLTRDHLQKYFPELTSLESNNFDVVSRLLLEAPPVSLLLPLASLSESKYDVL